jgi:hypothetical protein
VLADSCWARVRFVIQRPSDSFTVLRCVSCSKGLHTGWAAVAGQGSLRCQLWWSAIVFYSVLFYSILFYSYSLLLLFCSIPFWSVPFYSIQLYCFILFYSISFYSVLFHCVLLYSFLFCSILFNSILFHPIPFHSIPSYSILYHSVLFHCILFHSILFYSAPFYPVSLYSILREQFYFPGFPIWCTDLVSIWCRKCSRNVEMKHLRVLWKSVDWGRPYGTEGRTWNFAPCVLFPSDLNQIRHRTLRLTRLSIF